MCGRLRVKLVKVRGHGDTVERKVEVAEHKSISTYILNVRIIQLISWPLQGLPHSSAIIPLIDRLTNTLMGLPSLNKQWSCAGNHPFISAT